MYKRHKKKEPRRSSKFLEKIIFKKDKSHLPLKEFVQARKNFQATAKFYDKANQKIIELTVASLPQITVNSLKNALKIAFYFSRQFTGFYRYEIRRCYSNL